MTTSTNTETLPTRARRHRWKGAPVTILPDESKSGCEETHRTCEYCGLVRVTVHPPVGFPFSLWQYPDGERSDGLTPMCGDA
jgi:hypothetical protein